MKKLAIIGASYLQQPLVLRAKKMGLYTICFAWAECAVCKDVADKFYPVSIVEKEQILAICRQEQIDGICTIASDVAAPTVAYVAEQMGLVGNSYECALRANNKYLMRKAFSKADVPCPGFVCISKEENITHHTSNITHFPFPLIVKPSDRSGSLGVMKVEKAEDLLPAIKAAQGYSFKHEAMVEQFIEGREISVEFISYQGIHYPLQITDKVTTEAPHFVELEHHQPADLTDTQYKEIYAITQRALTALGVTNGASHSEYRITKEGKVSAKSPLVMTMCPSTPSSVAIFRKLSSGAAQVPVPQCESSAPCLLYSSAHSTGSPTSRTPSKLTPLTTLPFLTSRHGIILFASIIYHLSQLPYGTCPTIRPRRKKRFCLRLFR